MKRNVNLNFGKFLLYDIDQPAIIFKAIFWRPLFVFSFTDVLGGAKNYTHLTLSHKGIKTSIL